MKLNPSQIEKIKNYFAKQKDIVLVYLYGSFAYGNPHKDSDIDFGILFDPPIKTYYRLGEIINDLIDLGLPAEPDVRNIDLKASSVFLRNIVRGKLIYAHNYQAKTKFEVAVMKKYYDNQPLREISHLYMSKRLKEGTYGFRPQYNR